MQILSTWLPDAESFTSQVKSVDGWVHKLETAIHVSEKKRKDEVSDLRERLGEKDESLQKYSDELYRLQSMLRQQKHLLDRITPEMMEELKKKGTKDRAR